MTSPDVWAKVAATFNRLDGEAWEVEHYSDNPERLKLIREDRLTVSVYMDKFKKRASCFPSAPMMPGLYTPGIASLRDYVGETFEAGADIDRFTSKPELVAADFYRRVVAPYAQHYPKVLEKIEARKAGWQTTRDVAEQIVKTFKGEVSQHLRGDSITIYFRGSDLPTIDVGFGGRVDISRMPSMTAGQAMRVLGAFAVYSGAP